VNAKGSKAAQMKAFITQLDAVQAFFAGNLSATPQSAPISLDIGFRALPGDSPVSNQLIGWTVRAGDNQTVTWPGSSTTLSWNFGDPATLDLQWADRSHYTPLPDGTQGDLSVSGYHAVFQAGGAWAVLRWLDAHAAPASVSPLDPNQRLLRFQVPVLDNTAPASAGRGAASTGNADFYLTVKFSGVDLTTKAPVSLEPPTFPREAPVLW
jgi:type VI secretion system protein ImpL